MHSPSQWIPQVARMVVAMQVGAVIGTYLAISDRILIKAHMAGDIAALFALVCGLYGLVEIVLLLFRTEIRQDMLDESTWWIFVIFLSVNYMASGGRTSYCGILKLKHRDRQLVIGKNKPAMVTFEISIQN